MSSAYLLFRSRRRKGKRDTGRERESKEENRLVKELKPRIKFNFIIGRNKEFSHPINSFVKETREAEQVSRREPLGGHVEERLLSFCCCCSVVHFMSSRTTLNGSRAEQMKRQRRRRRRRRKKSIWRRATFLLLLLSFTSPLVEDSRRKSPLLLLLLFNEIPVANGRTVSYTTIRN